ncbi:MAG: arsenate reductase ArsC [Gammaproteobacteria bacterium]
MTANQRHYRVLFLCTGNSARSIIAEATLNRTGAGKFRAFSAGSHPEGAVHPLALALLERLDYPTEALRSKSWDEFAGPEAEAMDFVFTVCSAAAGEPCPVWPGHPVTASWPISDPAAVDGDEVERTRAFRTAFRELERRIGVFVNLPFEALDRLMLETRLQHIGQLGTAPAQAQD